MLTELKTAALVLAACLAVTGTGLLVPQKSLHAQAKAEPKAADAITELTPSQFDKFHAFLRPRAKEMRFGEIPWMFDLWEARKKAAAEGKPLLILGSSGNPCGTC